MNLFFFFSFYLWIQIKAADHDMILHLARRAIPRVAYLLADQSEA